MRRDDVRSRNVERPRIVVVGSGYAGFEAARLLDRKVGRECELTLISDSDHLNYTSLLPEVAAGIVDPRHNAVALHRVLRHTRIMLGDVADVDLDGRQVHVVHPGGMSRAYDWDRLLLAPGSVSRSFDIPGLGEYALAFKTLAQAVYLRDHVLRQLECADALSDAGERMRRCTFVVVGAGYSGTEFIAQMQLVVRRALPRFPTLVPQMIRWILVDAGPYILHELDPRLGRHASRRLTERGVEIRVETSVTTICEDHVILTDGTCIPTRTVVWTAGIAPHPLVAAMGRPTQNGRLVVDATLCVPGEGAVFAAGDMAAVPDATRPGRLCAPTAQHATRQGRRAARNIMASLDGQDLTDYRHKDLGFVVDLGGRDAAANPFGVHLTGLAAKTVTRGYHLLAIPTIGNKLRIAADWLLHLFLKDQDVRLGFVAEPATRVIQP